MEKKNIGLIITIIILGICVLGLSGYIIYDKKFSNNSITNQQSNVNEIQNLCDNQESNENSHISFEDDRYVSYKIESEMQCSNDKKEQYIVYDKNYNLLLNSKLNSENFEQITYFGKIDGKYYYFVSTYKGVPTKTNIYENGTLIKTIAGTYYSYDSLTKTFKFYQCPNTAASITYYWNPTTFIVDFKLDDNYASILIERKIDSLNIDDWTASDIKVISEGKNNTYLVKYIENKKDGSKTELSSIFEYNSDNDKWNFNLPGSTNYTDDILDKYDFKPINENN